MAKEKQDKLSSFGLTQEEFEKFKDVLPTFNIGQIEIGSKVHLTFLDSEPIMVEAKEFGKQTKVPTPCLRVHIETVFRKQSDGQYLEVPMASDSTLWLSSKTLAMGIYNLFEQNAKNLKGKKAEIIVGIANYKDYGEGRAYRVTQRV